MITRKIALTSETSTVNFSALSRTAAALEKQVHRDVAPLWKVDAIVSAFDSLDEVPIDYWPVIVTGDVAGAAGYHEDEDGQPYALVEAGSGWTVTASHEVLEMLIDPWGRHMVAGPSPKAGQGRVRFLVEICDPSESFSYTVNNVRVSDFYTPNYFDPVVAAGVRYSYMGAVKKPREVLRGGYLSWQLLSTREWWQMQFFTGSKPVFENLGRLSGSNVRAAIDAITGPKMKASPAHRSLSAMAKKTAPALKQEADAPAKARAGHLRGCIKSLLKR